MGKYSKEQLMAMKPREYRSIIRRGELTDIASMGLLWPCYGFAQANLAIVPSEYAYEFLMFCSRNPRPLPVLDTTDPGEPYPKLMAPDADLRTDLLRYRVFMEGEIIDEPTDITKYWRDDLVAFLLGCSRSFTQVLKQANVSWRRYGGHRTTIPCTPFGHFHGPMVVTPRAFYSSRDAVRAIQISSRHPLMHGPPIYIGAPVDIGIENIGEPDPFWRNRTPAVPPKPGEIVMYWGCGTAAGTVAVESKIPLMITHSPGDMFITDRLVEELAVL
jgi:uncharacterized protein YcsI (UPF0317 family)